MARRNSLADAQVAIAEAEAQEMRDAQARRAYALRLRGTSWWDIAEALELPEAAARDRYADAIRAASALVSEGSKRTLLDLEINRIDALQEAHWAAATQPQQQYDREGNPTYTTPPDVRAADFCLRAIEKRVKYQGLEDVSTEVASRTVIVAGTSEEYIAALRELAGPARSIEGTLEREDEAG